MNSIAGRRRGGAAVNTQVSDFQEKRASPRTTSAGDPALLRGQGQELIRTGPADRLHDLRAAGAGSAAGKKELRLSRAIRRLSYYEGLVIDHLGYVQQSREEMEVLFTVIGRSGPAY